MCFTFYLKYTFNDNLNIQQTQASSKLLLKAKNIFATKQLKPSDLHINMINIEFFKDAYPNMSTKCRLIYGLN